MISDAINNMLVRVLAALEREEGQTFVEYALIGFIVAVAIAGTLLTFTGNIQSALNAVGAKL